MSIEYAPKGLLGVLTPQANTTVEPELAILMPAGTAWINGRLMSNKNTIANRLRDYFDGFDDSVRQFANAPVGAVAFACTGASYLAGTAAEDATLQLLSDRLKVPVFTAASAVVDALQVLGAKRIGLVSPYDDELNAASIGYWRDRGFTIAVKSQAVSQNDTFHPIYSLPSGAAQAALDGMDRTNVDAVVMLGTGMPTLAPIMRSATKADAAPVISCMLCLAWRAATFLEKKRPSRESFMAWVAADHWKSRLG